jgi:signal transduction histidine kinase
MPQGGSHRNLRTRRLVRTLLIVGAMAFNLTLQVTGFIATDRAERPEVSWVTLHATVPIVFALCAAVAWRFGAASAARLMVALPLLWVPQTFYAVIGGNGAIWPLMRSVDLLWGVLVGMLALGYPSGAYRTTFQRTIAIIALAASAVHLIVVVLLVTPEAFGCPCVPNVYQVFDAPAVFAIVDIGYRIVGVALALLIAIRLLVQWMRGSVPARTVAFIMPIALIAWAVTLTVQAVTYAATTTADQVLATVSLIAVATIPLAYVGGVVHARNLRARVADLMRITSEGADREIWVSALRRVLRDDSVRVYWWDESTGRYADASEAPLPPEHPGEGTLPIAAAGGKPIAVIRHDHVLTQNTRLLDGVSSALRLTVDNGRLRSEIERTLDQVRESRQRIVTAGVEARRRIERDLHDGAQQRLVSLSLALRFLADRLESAGELQTAAGVEELIAELGVALADLRRLAQGIHPSLLTEGGLPLALPELAGRCPVPVELDIRVPGRLPELVESTVYFIVSEALANVAKHAGASHVWLRVETADAHVELAVRDNGVGGAGGPGSGLTGLADRAEAAGGSLEVDSPTGAGTCITARIPLAEPAADLP